MSSTLRYSRFFLLTFYLSHSFAQFEYLQCTNSLPPTFPNPRAKWSSWSLIEGRPFSSEPTAISRTNSIIEVFVRGGSIYEIGRWIYNQNTWGSSQSLLGDLASAPVPVLESPNNLFIRLLAKSFHGSLITVVVDCHTFTCIYGWLDLGGHILYGPAATPWEANRIDVFVVDRLNAVSWRTSIHGSWSAWKSLPNPGILVNKVAAVSRIPGTIDLFGIGQDHRLYHRSYTHSEVKWSPWTKVNDREVTSSPTAVSGAPHRMDVFVRGKANDLLQIVWEVGQWSDYISLGGILTSAPGAVVRTGNRIDVFVRGADFKLYQISYV